MDQHAPARGPRTKGNRAPTNLSLPVDVRERLRTASEETGIPQCRIAEQGLRLRLAQIERAQPTKECKS
ncbi:ribbon-helix-helix domain-containing protein [Sorangium sp. So ce1024]|uniref:ribbon-helix-helix domain-containing protein n=1 Tax=Sorangium sp. So ce1024 TaxID=3133327 RepID=UPI003F523521